MCVPAPEMNGRRRHLLPCCCLVVPAPAPGLPSSPSSPLARPEVAIGRGICWRLNYNGWPVSIFSHSHSRPRPRHEPNELNRLERNNGANKGRPVLLYQRQNYLIPSPSKCKGCPRHQTWPCLQPNWMIISPRSSCLLWRRLDAISREELARVDSDNQLDQAARVVAGGKLANNRGSSLLLSASRPPASQTRKDRDRSI